MVTSLRSWVSPSAVKCTGEILQVEMCLITTLPQKINRGGVQEQIRPLLENRGELIGSFLTVDPTKGREKEKDTTFRPRKKLVGKVLTSNLHCWSRENDHFSDPSTYKSPERRRWVRNWVPFSGGSNGQTGISWDFSLPRSLLSPFNDSIHSFIQQTLSACFLLALC